MIVTIPSWLMWILGFVGVIIVLTIIVIILMYTYTGYRLVKAISTSKANRKIGRYY